MRRSGSGARRRPPRGCWLLTLVASLIPAPLPAQAIAVRHREGANHGLVVLRSDDGRTIATGDTIQTVRGARVSGKLTLHFLDGSLHEEASVFEQRSTFRLLSDRLLQHGPAFPHPMNRLIDAVAGEVTVWEADGRSRSYRLSIPDDAANGLIVTFLKNLPSLKSETTVSMVVTSSKPRVVKLHIRPDGSELFSASGPERECLHFVGHTEIPGATGIVAHVIGKQPPDVDFWVLEGEVPAFLKFRGSLYEEGPAWNLELASPKFEHRSRTAETPMTSGEKQHSKGDEAR